MYGLKAKNIHYLAFKKTFSNCCHRKLGFPGGASGKNPLVSSGDMRHRFDPWIRNNPWKRAWQPTPVFLPGESLWKEEPGDLWKQEHGVT